MQDDELLTAFESCTLPFDQWTHRSHVRMAYIYLTKFPFEDALQQIRAGIKKYNTVKNVPEGPDRGYNETTTHALVHLIASVSAAYKHTHRVSNSDEFCDMHPQLMSKHVLRFFYSPKQRTHPMAKTQFIEPDLAPLPRIME